MRRLTCTLVLSLLPACPADEGATVPAGTTTDTTTTTATSTTTASDPTSTTTPTTSGPEPGTETSPVETQTTATETTATVTSATETTTLTDTSATDTDSDTGDTDTTDTDDSDTGDTDTADTDTGVVGECTPGEVMPCYSGPPGTLGVGLCGEGERTCDAGGFWGACLGEVLPAPDTCSGAGDEACDGDDDDVVCGQVSWSRAFGGGGKEAGQRVAFDGAGNLVVAAHGTSVVDFGGGALNSAGKHDLFLARYTPDGTLLWSKRFGDAAEQVANSLGLAVDAAGDIALSGDFAGTIDFGGGPLVAQQALSPFVARLGPDGAHVWSKTFPIGGSAQTQSVAFDAAGDLAIGGYFAVSIDLGGGVLNAVDSADAFVAKLGPDGAHKWSRAFGAAAAQVVRSVAPTADGGVCVGGAFDGVIDLGVGPMMSAGGIDVFVGCLDPAGETLWSDSFGDSDYQQLNELVIDTKGRLTFGGETWGMIDLGGGPLGTEKFPSYVAQFEADGTHRWSRLVSEGDLQLRGLGTDGLGSLLLAGDYSGFNDFGAGVVNSVGFSDLFVVKLDGDGEHIWSRVFHSDDSQLNFDVAGSSTGQVAATGSFLFAVDYGNGPIKSKGNHDGHVAVFTP